MRTYRSRWRASPSDAQVVTRLGCEASGPDGARFLLAAGFPTRHGATEYLANCSTPKIFIQSTHDQFGPCPELETLYAGWSEPKRMIWIEAADHFFAGALEELEQEVTNAVLDLPNQLPS